MAASRPVPAGRRQRAERSGFPKRLDLGKLREGPLGLEQQRLFSAGRGKLRAGRGAFRLAGFAPKLIGDQGVARGEVIEAAECVLQVFKCRQRLRAALGPPLTGKRGSEEFGGVTQALGANAQAVPLLYAAMPEVDALVLDPLAEAAKLRLGVLREDASPTMYNFDYTPVVVCGPYEYAIGVDQLGRGLPEPPGPGGAEGPSGKVGPTGPAGPMTKETQVVG